MDNIATLGILAIVWAIVKVLGIITLFYLFLKIYKTGMYYLELKTKYLEQKMGLDND